MDVVYPLLLELYSDYRDGVLLKQDFIPIIALTESYICRRAVCGFGTNSLNKVFPTFTKKINKNQYLESIEKRFGSLKGNQRFPNDDEFKEELMRKDFYKFQKNRYFFERLENFDTKEPVNTQECTIEHIMPQTLNDDWKRDLGQDHERIHTQYLHTIGNLTLTGYNSKYSNRSFKEKRDMEGGYKDSPLRLNQSLKDLESFGEQEILNRTKDLATRALKIWESPKLDIETFDLSHYNFSPYSRELFDILSEGIKALDERITESRKQEYIAYKLETIFTSIVPSKKKLKLMLKIKFSELQDEIKEKLKIRDVSNIGHQGVGSTEVTLETKENIPYCLGLIKQALEKQRGGRSRQ